MSWYEVKLWLELTLALDMDALHIYAGVLLQLLACLILRRTLASPLPWLVVLVAVAANEAYDLAYEIWPQRSMQYAEGLKDSWNTLLLPTALMLLARFAPRLLAPR